jgi:hypothetical protein
MRRHSIFTVIGLAGVWTLVLAAPAPAQDFSLQVGPPIAGNAQPAKSSLLVVRPGGCADPARATITATAEGIVGGVRKSVPLTLAPLPTPGVHAVPNEWAPSGVWVINLVGTCAGKTAGAIVSLGPKAPFRRDAVKLLPHRATPAEITASLKALSTGGQE